MFVNKLYKHHPLNRQKAIPDKRRDNSGNHWYIYSKIIVSYLVTSFFPGTSTTVVGISNKSFCFRMTRLLSTF